MWFVNREIVCTEGDSGIKPHAREYLLKSTSTSQGMGIGQQYLILLSPKHDYREFSLVELMKRYVKYV